MKMTKFKIDYDEERHVTRERNPDDEWDNDDSVSSYYFKSAKIIKGDNTYYDVAIPENISPGADIFVLVANYETGDSFCRYTAKPEFIGAFKTYDEAYDVEKQIRAYEKKKEKHHDEAWPCFGEVIIHGQKCKLSFPWAGYFEHLNSFEIERLMVERDR